MKILILSFFLILNSDAKLLDKITAVINDRVITQSEIGRIEKTIPARKEISGFIYSENNYNQNRIINLIFRSYIVRDKLTELGYVISDDSVESRIQMTEQKLGLRREDLLEFLKTKNITFNEYFELMRESMEYNIFTSKIIHPLISITDQEIKNTFYKQFKDQNTLSFTYHLVDYYIENSSELNKDDFRNKIQTFVVSGILEEKYKSVEANDLGKTKEDDLSKDIRSVLKKTDEGEFTKPLTIGNYTHIFYVKTKDLAESSAYIKQKEVMRDLVFAKKAKSVSDSWFDRELFNYYTKTMIK